MSRAIWKGNISFGLVNIPVGLHSADERNEMSFKLLDRRNMARVRYKRVNDKTGEEVSWDEIVKGYEYEEDQFVVLSDKDFQRANVEATQTVEITGFVEASDISPIYFDKPYYLEPLKKAGKSYALLREILRRTNKVGIAKIVIRSKQYIATVFASGNVIVVNLLRYAHEIRDAEKLNVPKESLKELDINEKEIELGERLVEAMVQPWKPEKYQDTYRADLLKLIDKKIKSGATEAIAPTEEEEVKEPKRQARILDMTELLKRSVEKAQKRGPQKAARPSERRRKVA
jgi:DNA end-binding protein Ku